MRIQLIKVLTGLLLIISAGCGGGGGASSPAPTPTSPTTAVITYKTAEKQQGNSTVTHGLQFSAYLPPGVDVPLDAGTHTIQSSKLIAGSALSMLNIQIFGTYSAPIRKLKFGVIPTDKNALQQGFKSGEIFSLTCGLTNSAALSESNFNTPNNSQPITDFRAYRYTANNSVDDVSSALTVSLKAVVQ